MSRPHIDSAARPRSGSPSMNQTVRIVLITLISVLLAAVGFLLAFMYSGTYNVAASARHTAVGNWMLQTIQENSIRAHARELAIDVPAVNGAQLQHGIEHFVYMCAPCHGAPGIERGEYGKGITPLPPDLAHAAREWSARELYWIVKHGIKLAGMPAFGTTHSEEQLWGIVSFVQQLPNLSAAEYQRVTSGMQRSEAAQGSDSEHSHEHVGPG
jgi:mono/diheme cytochrome c family protein